ncbi:shikimate kinase [Stenoxybacter acetivorans]|uniref:shikimate kinase n=1 Tax=Stenoxybacter acetivorans TaxID=422441 RepID=UPI00055DF0CD|nr:shikimate kinase [Stenoxybacter acetivorans]
MPAMKTAANLFLIGLMGAGKTTLGRSLAARLDFDFYDSDLVIIERTGVSIPTIFDMEGEAGFRAREAAVIDDLTRLNRIVLATGGGAVLSAVNRQALKNRGTVVYLHAQPSLLLERTRLDKNRPLLQVADPLSKLTELYQARDALYRAAAHLVIDIHNQHCQHTIQQLLSLLKSEGFHANLNR